MASPSYRHRRTPSTDDGAVLVRVGRALAAAPLKSEDIDGSPVLPSSSGGLTPVSRRERLLAAATSSFARRGYHETSMDDIGALVDVTGPNLYVYFSSKAELLRAVVERGTHALWIDLEDALRGRTDPRDALAALGRAYVRRRAARPHLGRQLSGEPEVEEVAVTYQREYVAEWVALLRSARPELDHGQARLLVHVAIAIADDLTATQHLYAFPAFADNAAALVLAALDA